MKKGPFGPRSLDSSNVPFVYKTLLVTSNYASHLLFWVLGVRHGQMAFFHTQAHQTKEIKVFLIKRLILHILDSTNHCYELWGLWPSLTGLFPSISKALSYSPSRCFHWSWDCDGCFSFLAVGLFYFLFSLLKN